MEQRAVQVKTHFYTLAVRGVGVKEREGERERRAGGGGGVGESISTPIMYFRGTTTPQPFMYKTHWALMIILEYHHNLLQLSQTGSALTFPAQ